MRTARNNKGLKAVHYVTDDGKALCGRSPTEGALILVELPATCRWCIRALAKPPKTEHRMIRICAACRTPWPCEHAPREDRCKGTTAAGKPCQRKPRWEGVEFCRAHDRV